MRCFTGHNQSVSSAFEPSYPEWNFKGNQLLGGSIGLSPLCRTQATQFARQNSFWPPLQFPTASPWHGIVHHLSGPMDHAFTQNPVHWTLGLVSHAESTLRLSLLRLAPAQRSHMPEPALQNNEENIFAAFNMCILRHNMHILRHNMHIMPPHMHITPKNMHIVPQQMHIMPQNVHIMLQNIHKLCFISFDVPTRHKFQRPVKKIGFCLLFDGWITWAGWGVRPSHLVVGLSKCSTSKMDIHHLTPLSPHMQMFLLQNASQEDSHLST